MALLIEKPWRTQPTGPLVIDWSNPITQGMFLCWAGDLRGKTVVGPNGTANGVIARQVTLQGPAANNNGEKVSNGTVNNYISFQNLTSTDLTFLVVGGRNSTPPASNVAMLVATRSGNGSAGIELYAGNAFGDATKWSASDFGATETNQANALNGILSVNTGAAPTTIVNGTIYSYIYTLSNASQGGQHTLLAKGIGTNRYTYDVFCSLYVVWTRRVSNAELVSLSINPYQIFRPLELQLGPAYPRIYYVAGPNATWATPTSTEIINGQLAGGGAATASWSESAPLQSTNPFNFSQPASPLTTGTKYRAAAVQKAGDSNVVSNVVESDPFLAGAATLSNPEATEITGTSTKPKVTVSY